MQYAPPWSEGVRNLIRRMAHDFTSRGAEITVIGPETPLAITRGNAQEKIINVPLLPKWLCGSVPNRVWQAATAWLTLQRVP